MNRPLSAVWLGTLVAIFALFVFGMKQTTPEAPRIPAVIVEVTPIDTTQEVQHIVIDNLAPTAPEPTTTPYPIAPQPTTFVESLPICDKAKPGELCAPMRVLPVPTPTPWQTCNNQSYHDSWSVVEPCLKPAESPTPIPTPTPTPKEMFR